MNIKVLGKNIVIYSIGNIALRAVSVLLIPLYTRYLSVENYGLLDICIITIQILVIFMSLGMPQSLIRYYKGCEKKEEIGALYTTSFSINLLGGIVLIFLMWIFTRPFSRLIFGGKVYIYILLIVTFISLVRSLSVLSLSFFRAKNKALTYSIFAVIIMIGLLITNVIFVVYLKRGVLGILYSNLIVYGCAALFIGIYILSKHRPKISISISKKLFSFGSPLIFSMSGWFILHMSSRYFLAHYSGLGEVGIYGLGYRIATILLILVVMPFQLAFGPFIFSQERDPKLKEKISRVFTYLLLILFFSSWGTALISRNIIQILAPPEYNESYFVILLILPAIISMGIYYWAASLLHLMKKTKLLALIIISSAIVNIILNILLIPKYGWHGAAVSTNISIFLATFSNFFFGVKYYKIEFEISRLYKMGMSFFVLVGVLIFSIQFSSLLYYFMNGFTCLVIFIILFKSKFLCDNERKYLQDVLLKVRSKR
ncbi:MAG: flippase [Candidatus Aminicenantia bacterium]